MSENTPENGTERVHPQDPAEGPDPDPDTMDPDAATTRVQPQDPAEGPDDESATS